MSVCLHRSRVLFMIITGAADGSGVNWSDLVGVWNNNTWCKAD